MWPIDEYPISRLMLVCPIAANAPSTIEAIETKIRICCHWIVMVGNAVVTTRTNSAMAAIFGAAAKKAVTGVGAPSYTSGVHMWNGTADTLKQRPTIRNTSPKVRPRPPSTAALAMPGNETVPVKP